jgi:hypothetical protein
MIYLQLKNLFLNNFVSVSSQQSTRFHYLETWDGFLVTGENVKISNVYASINALVDLPGVVVVSVAFQRVGFASL